MDKRYGAGESGREGVRGDTARDGEIRRGRDVPPSTLCALWPSRRAVPVKLSVRGQRDATPSMDGLVTPRKAARVRRAEVTKRWEGESGVVTDLFSGPEGVGKRQKMARLSFACNPAATLLPLCYWCEAYDEVCMHPCCLRTCMQPSSPVFDWVDRGRGG